jgi:DNA phosphorothioation-dependent restriction protein DptG
MNIMALAKGAERYLFLYDDQSHQALIEVFERFAGDDQLNFSYGDAVLLTQKLREAMARRGLGRFPSCRGS